MNNLYEILDSAHGGEAMAMLGREFGLTPAQTQSAVMALLPAISTGLKQSTATPEGLGNLFGMMGHQQDLQAMHRRLYRLSVPSGCCSSASFGQASTQLASSHWRHITAYVANSLSDSTPSLSGW